MSLDYLPHTTSSRKILSATSFPRSPTSPIGPTQLGHPDSHAQHDNNFAAPSSSRGASLNNAALCPIPPG
jgi:hypothetical protein